MSLPFDQFRDAYFRAKFMATGGENVAINKLIGDIERNIVEGVDLIQWVNPKVLPLIAALQEELGVEVRARMAPTTVTDDPVEAEHLTEEEQQP